MLFQLLLSTLPLLALSVPHGRNNHEPAHRLEERDYPDYGFKGILWRSVDNQSICTTAQRDILLQTVKNIDLFASQVTDFSLVDNPAWERFMGGRHKKGQSPQPKFTWFVSNPA
jgi:hypothetical protein